MIKEMLGTMHALKRAKEDRDNAQRKVDDLEAQFDFFKDALIKATGDQLAIYDYEDYRILVRKVCGTQTVRILKASDEPE